MNRFRRPCVGFAAFAAVVIGALFPGVDAAVDAPTMQSATFSTTSELVVLHVTVKDRNGTYLTDLTRDAFSVLDQGRPQTIQFFSGEDAPVTVGLLVDNSGSMLVNRDKVLTAVAAFAEAGNPQDEMFALTFNEHVGAVLPADTPFTSRADILQTALTQRLTTRGRTALYDAVGEGLRYLDRGQYPRKVLVLVSDGGDNASRATFEQVALATEASNAILHAVALADRDDRGANPKLLERLARATGGLWFNPRNASRVHDALQQIARDIRHSYTLGFAPAATSAPGTHALRVIVTAPAHRGLEVRTRSAYVAGAREAKDQIR